jgi:Tol biopolymer transport system component
LAISGTAVDRSTASRIPLTTSGGFFPRVGPGFVLYVASTGTGQALWKLAGGSAAELWSAAGARFLGSPAVAPDGSRIAFSIEQQGRTLLYVMNNDGTNVRVVTEALELRGAPAWAPDGRSITTAANDGGVPRLFDVSLDGRSIARLSRDYAVDPIWSPDGTFVVYSGADVGTAFPARAISRTASPYPLPSVTLTRGARSLRFLPGRRALLVLRGDIEHKDVWAIDLETGAERQLTHIAPDFQVGDFDVSPDGRELILVRVEEHSNVVLFDLPRR